MTMTKLKFIDSLKNEKERNEDIVEMTVTEMMIFELKELLVNTKMFLTLMNETIVKMKQDWQCLSCWNSSLMSENAWIY